MSRQCGFRILSTPQCKNPVTSKVAWINSKISMDNKFALETFARYFCDEHEPLIKGCEECPVLHISNGELIIKHEGECTVSIFTTQNVREGTVPEKNLCHKCAKLQAIFNNTVLLAELVNKTNQGQSRRNRRSRE